MSGQSILYMKYLILNGLYFDYIKFTWLNVVHTIKKLRKANYD